MTQADRRRNELIVAGCTRSFPDGMLAEESTDTDAASVARRVWMVDPLDGKKGFHRRSGDFAVRSGWRSRARAFSGVVYQPFADVLHWAARGHGAWVARPETGDSRSASTDEQDVTRMRLAASAHTAACGWIGWCARWHHEEVRRNSAHQDLALIVERSATY